MYSRILGSQPYNGPLGPKIGGPSLAGPMESASMHEALVDDGLDVALGYIDIWLNIDDPTNATLSNAKIVASVTEIGGGIGSVSESEDIPVTQEPQNFYFEGSSCWFRGGLSMTNNLTDKFRQDNASAELNISKESKTIKSDRL